MTSLTNYGAGTTIGAIMFLRTSQIKGVDYYRLVENRRVGKHVVQDTLVYFGKDKPDAASLHKFREYYELLDCFKLQLGYETWRGLIKDLFKGVKASARD
jgi:hypothetical protein